MRLLKIMAVVHDRETSDLLGEGHEGVTDMEIKALVDLDQVSDAWEDSDGGLNITTNHGTEIHTHSYGIQALYGMLIGGINAFNPEVW